MYTLLLLICCGGFFCLYNTSLKAKLAGEGIIACWLQSNRRRTRILGIAAIMICFGWLVFVEGAVMGTIESLLMLMVAGCYIVALAPFRLFRAQHILVLGGVALLMELLIF